MVASEGKVSCFFLIQIHLVTKKVKFDKILLLFSVKWMNL
jgi:hypothetical protein